MSDEPEQQPETQPPPAGQPPVEPGGGLSETEIQQAIANSTDWIQKDADKDKTERR